MRTQTTGSAHDSNIQPKMLQMTDDGDYTATMARKDNQKWGNHAEVGLCVFSWEDTDENLFIQDRAPTNDRPKKRFHLSLAWRTCTFTEVTYRSVGKELLTKEWLT